MQDWKDALSALSASGALPAGEESVQQGSEGREPERKLPKLTLFYEKKGRAGKPATIITGFEVMTDDETADIARTLKQRLGCGGSTRGGEILLQGDRRQQAAAMLREMGFRI